MFSFTSDPCRQLIRHLANGPAFVNTALDKIGRRMGITPLQDAGQWAQRINILEQVQSRIDKQYYPFLEGYLHWQAGLVAADARPHYERAVAAFTRFAAQAGNNAELQYVAQWQTALLHLSLGVEWPVVEEALLEAFNGCPKRGEALQTIVEYYLFTAEEPEISYIYARYCYKHFLQQTPAGNWLVNVAFYEWGVLEYHMLLCHLRGRTADAQEDYKRLRLLVSKQPQLFTPEDEARIKGYQQLVAGLSNA